MIVTVTPNPSLDRALEVDHLAIGEVNRAHAVHVDAGGKGINVSRALVRQGVSSLAVLPVGGVDGERLVDLLAQHGVPAAPVPVHGDTRSNVTLVDASGAVIGINSAGRFSVPDGSGGETPVSGIGYAIPINYARQIAEQLIRSGSAKHGSIGAQGRSVTDGNRQGAYLIQVAPGGAAAKAGLVNGDVIVAADGRTVTSYDQLVVIVQQHRPGDRVTVTYFHGGQKHTATLTLGTA